MNGLGEIMKLALVRSTELFGLLEDHGARLVKERFQVCTCTDETQPYNQNHRREYISAIQMNLMRKMGGVSLAMTHL